MRLGLSLKLPGLTAWGGYPVPYLFQNGEQGFWYDPSDFSTLFQDAAGTTPVTAVEQPCSLMLDKRLGLTLGSELVTNGDFSNGTTGWTAVGLTIAVVGGELQMTRTGSGQYVYQTLTTVAGRRYFVTFNYRNGTTTSAVFVGSTVGGTDLLASTTVNSAQTASFTCSFLAVGTASTIAWGLNAISSTAFIDNISVRELPGNHAFTPAAASTARPTVSARVNGLVATEDLTSASWTKTGVTITANAIEAPNGTLTADLASGGGNWLAQTSTLTGQANQSILAGAWIRGASGVTSITVRVDRSGIAQGNQTVKTISPNVWTWVTHLVTLDGNTAAPVLRFDLTGGDAYIWGADLRVANDGVGLPDYQRVNTATDYDPVGFPVYLRFDQSNDYMLTNSIDFSGTDKVTVAAGVRKASDAAQGVVIELSATIASNNGTFLLAAPDGATNTYGWDSKGTSQVDAVATSQVAPLTSVLLGLADIANDVCILQVNGVQADSDTGDQGSGNYGNFPVYIGARAGTSAFFGSRLYGTVGRGALNNDQQNAALTAYLNSKTRAF